MTTAGRTPPALSHVDVQRAAVGPEEPERAFGGGRQVTSRCGALGCR